MGKGFLKENKIAPDKKVVQRQSQNRFYRYQSRAIYRTDALIPIIIDFLNFE